MVEPLNAIRYMSYIRSQWRWIAGSALAAVIFAVGGSLLLPKEYTAKARIFIEPPAGLDPRSAMAVSPVYLEALKTYEEFASSDSLFLDAVNRFHLRARFGARPIETLKRRILKVEVVRNTRILEISATLPDASAAHELARFLAEATVALNQAAVLDNDRELTDSLEQQKHEAKARVEAVERSWAEVVSNEPTDDLKAAIESAADERERVQESLHDVELELADDANRLPQASDAQAAEIRKEQVGASARMKELRRQLEEIEARNAGRERLLGERSARRSRLEAERKAAQTALVAVDERLGQMRGDIGYRGERLKIIDPGVVPERPSSPNVPLNAAAALLLGLLLPTVYLLLAVTYEDQKLSARRSLSYSRSL